MTDTAPYRTELLIARCGTCAKPDAGTDPCWDCKPRGGVARFVEPTNSEREALAENLPRWRPAREVREAKRAERGPREDSRPRSERTCACGERFMMLDFLIKGFEERGTTLKCRACL